MKELMSENTAGNHNQECGQRNGAQLKPWLKPNPRARGNDQEWNDDRKNQLHREVSFKKPIDDHTASSFEPAYIFLLSA